MGHPALRTPLAVGLALLFLLALAPAASADRAVCGPGSAAGQCESPARIAVDTASERLYVADTGNHRIDVFEASGSGEFLFAFGWGVRSGDISSTGLDSCTTLSGCQAGFAGTGAGQLNGSSALAVDPSSHVLYVAEEANHRVQKFDAEGHFLRMFGKGVNSGTSGKADLCTNAGAPTDVCGAGIEGAGAGAFQALKSIAVGPAGSVYVADTKELGSCPAVFAAEISKRVQKFNASGEPTEQIPLTDDPCGQIHGLAVDSTGAFYVGTDGSTGGVRKYSATGTPFGAPYPVDLGNGNIGGLGIDPGGDPFVLDFEGGVGPLILEFSPAGTQLKVFFGSGSLKGLARALAFFHTADGDVFISQESGVVQIPLPEPGPLLVPGSTKASPVGNVKATLRTTFNSEGKASKAHFQYITKAAYEVDGNAFGAGTLETPDSEETLADFASHTVKATNTCVVPGEATCLEHETTYYFRPIAGNADGEVIGERAEFTTLPPLLIPATWSTDVGTDSGRLHAEVNPLGLATTGRFEYVNEAHFQSEGGFASPHTQTTAVIDFGSGEEAVLGASQIVSLQPSTVYRYRLVAEDPFFAPVSSEAHVFTTFPLPSAVEEACPANAAFRSGPSAALPDCRAYEMVSPLDKNNGDIRTLLNTEANPTFLDQSSTEGSGFAYSSYRAFANPKSAPYTNQYLATRGAEGWQTESLDPKGKGSEFLENPFKAFSADLSSAWLSWRTDAGEPTPGPCAPTGVTQLYRRENNAGAFGALSCAHPSLESLNFLPEVQGFSADGSHSVFRADSALTEDASGATTVNPSLRPIYQLYESTGAAQLHLVSVLPDGEAAGEDSSAGTAGDTNAADYYLFNRKGSLLGAVSQDGTRVFWGAANSGTLGPLYLRINADQKQSNVVAGKCTQPARACTIPVSETVTPEPARFQAGNPQGTKALFKVEAGPLKGNLYEFDSEDEPPTSHLVARGVLGNILGASEDLSRVYFASAEATAQQQAEGALEGQPNVYLADEGPTRFVATLSNGGGETSDVNNPFGTPIATSPTFRTARVSPDGRSLVFMSNSGPLAERAAGYDNADATSARPDAEVYFYDATANGDEGKLRCVSCNPSGARPSGRELEKENVSKGKIGPWGAATIPRFETQLYQPRYLSDDGRRVFFDSFDPLVLGDTNGKEDAYEWEEAGEGGCKEASPSYIPASEGCLRLLSSGQSPVDSEFLDANATGSDAFFTTAEGLLPQDYGLIDVYDARVDGGFPPPASIPPSCEGEACQGSPQAPNDPTPASASGEGAGNVVEKPARKKKHHKAKKRHHKRAAKRNRRSAR
jgi:hypothetical protein